MKSGIENISETLQTALKASPIKGKGQFPQTATRWKLGIIQYC